MKNCSEKKLRALSDEYEGAIKAHNTLKSCVEKFILDKEHKLSDEVVEGLTYKELIKILLLAEERADDYWQECEVINDNP